MSESAGEDQAQGLVDRAVAEGGAYEVLHKRLLEQGRQLAGLAEALNAQRQQEFGSQPIEVIGRTRVRTENNCIARDIAQVGGLMLFGYNVFIGLKQETRVQDVFSLYRLVQQDGEYDAQAVDLAGSFLAEASFVNDFDELYRYYKNTRLLQLSVRDGKLLAAFQIGERISDVRVFRWSVSADGGQVRYIDNRGERDIQLPRPFDFEWTAAGRDAVVQGRHSHFNILDTLFVDTLGGDLTVKVENNTEDGLGIYREPVADKTQSLNDVQIEYAHLGTLILLKVLPYREEQWRYLVFNTLTRKVQRIDAIGQACVQLPEDHGIIFPGGCYLQSGEYRTFDQPMDGMRFKRSVRSPNGEDVQYVFYHPEQGRSALFTYNLISRELQSPQFGHGHARLADGRMVIFSAEGDEPTRIHPMQIWQTPFYTDEHAATQPQRGGFFGRIGNAELVRGVSDLLNLAREIDSNEVSLQRYALLCQETQRLFDAYYWLSDEACGGVAPLLRQISSSAAMVLDEFEKVESIRQQSARAMTEAQTRQQELMSGLSVQEFSDVQAYVDALGALNAQRGKLLTIREYRYINVAQIDEMEAQLLTEHERLAAEVSSFLAGEQALAPYHQQLQALDTSAEQAETVTQLAEPLEQLIAMAAGLDMLSELIASLRIDDATQRTRVVEAISELYAKLNQSKARAELRRKSLGSAEQVAQFGAQFKLFSQAITNALALAQDPESCDEQLSRLLVQLEELESQFGGHEAFLSDILDKREELLETFEAHRQRLLDERQRRAQGLQDAAVRIIDSLPRRTGRLTEPDLLNAFFATDPLILKLRELIERLRDLHDNVKADDIEARLKGARDQAVRGLRDKRELFEGGGNVIRLGPRHRFSVNAQELDLTLLPRGDSLSLHLTGTDYFEPLVNDELDALRDYWDGGLLSESPQLYRAEYLAGEVIALAQRAEAGLSMELLHQQLLEPEHLVRTLREIATPRYREGYEKGIHDHDAALILAQLLPLLASAGLLRFDPQARALAMLFWAQSADTPAVSGWAERAAAVLQIQQLFGRADALLQLQGEVQSSLAEWLQGRLIEADSRTLAAAAAWLIEWLAEPQPIWQVSRYAQQLYVGLQDYLAPLGLWDSCMQSVERLAGAPGQQWQFLQHWFSGLCEQDDFAPLRRYVPEAVALCLLQPQVQVTVVEVDLRFAVSGLLGQHPRVRDGALTLAVDEFFTRLRQHRQDFQPGLERYQQLRQQLLDEQRKTLRLAEFKPRPLTSFVRNRLINDVYLGVIGDNLAKQMGTVGEGRRSDLNGLLMLISPPGYGKTTLMEYVAHALGLVFMKINGPALGHEVRSLDPAQAPDATAAQELVKLNLALEMGNNVMLYVDDIQHTHPEFLQKFISLCDGTRRIEGVWKGRTRTYDMRGRKFAVVMAGNPYTESGEVFRIPDMLANRADIYNLGDTLAGMNDVFALSYIENSLTSNSVLAPLAGRDLNDLYRLVAKAEGKPFSANELSYDYSAAEINDMVATLQRMMQLRDVVLRVNQQYIASAAQDDGYRTEPPFKLQGSYRNMNKLAEKVSAVMNEQELQQLVDDHYQGESQLLTTGAEENLLKLAELRGTLNAERAERWRQIKADFLRNRAMGGDDADVGKRVVGQLSDLVQSVRALAGSGQSEVAVPWDELLAALQSLHKLSPKVRVVMPPQQLIQQMLDGLSDSMRATVTPLADVMDRQVVAGREAQTQLLDIVRQLKVVTLDDQDDSKP
ncbi:DNA repair ATPase [Halopseudomonas maritima]|uniref:DNA repair ATPase n=1 Tax=Halopseudomonas maritima TaxID=2918528 RepID=UPI001EEA15FB|nr:DNA repair ATPase [Halopseudomonas maritima]UJJ30723.1 DNA repair ATPase [Halopseudomonas maritima]